MKDFFHASHVLGSSPVFVQGGGGNTSVKIGYKMFVKASGFRLASVAPRHGYTCCVHKPIRSFLDKANHEASEGDRALNALIDAHTLPDYHFGLASIETGLHAVIPSEHVYHTHSVYANIFNCMAGGHHHLERMFLKPSKSIPTPLPIMFVPYMNPGYELARYLARQVSVKGSLPSLIFLQNHGLITHHDSPHAALGLMKTANRRIAEYLHEEGGFRPFAVHEAQADFSRHLFPDSVVYSSLDPKHLSSSAQATYNEIASANNYILTSIKQLGGEPTFLKPEDTRYIRDMDKEKHRLAMVREV
jgi:rhamnose utilization protein RhaD (predicted bifunctional aldolase and dehydrogenase)